MTDKARLNEIAERLADEVAERPEIRRRGMFGYPGFLARGKMVACVIDERVTVKLSPDRVADLVAAGHAPFAPNNRPMTGWVLVPYDLLVEQGPDGTLLDEAIDYVLSLSDG